MTVERLLFIPVLIQCGFIREFSVHIERNSVTVVDFSDVVVSDC